MNILVKNRKFGSAVGALTVAVLVAGCSSAGSGLPAQVLPQMSMPKSVSPALIKAAPMAKTAILPASAMHSPTRTQSDIKGLNWTEIPGSASQVAAAADGSIRVLSTAPSGVNKYIWHYASGTWTNIAGLASQIAVAPNGTLYAINSGGGTYAFSGGNWTALGGGASGITAGADNSIYVLSNGGSGPDQAIWHNVSGTWSQVPGSGVTLAGSFDSGTYAVPGGTISPGGLYILNSQGAIYYENTGGSFVQLPANASALAPTTAGGVFALGYPANASGNTIYYYNLNAPGWSAQSGAGVSISSNAGQLYVIGASGGIYSSPVTTPASETLAIASESMGEIAFYPVGGAQAAETITNANVMQQQFQPTTMALDAQNDVFATDQYSNSVFEFAPPYTGADSQQISTGAIEPISLAVNSQGTLFVGIVDAYYSQGTNQAVRMYQPPYSTETDLSIPAGDQFAPFCFALDSQQNLFATNVDQQPTLEYAPPYTGSPTAFAFGGSSGYLNGGGCAIDTSNGALFVASGSATSVYSPPYTGQATTISQGAGGNAAIAVSSANHDLFLAGASEVDVYASPYTSLTTSITNGVNQPSVLAVDASGNLFVASANNGTITEYAPPYAGAPVWTLDAFGIAGSSWMLVIP